MKIQSQSGKSNWYQFVISIYQCFTRYRYYQYQLIFVRTLPPGVIHFDRTYLHGLTILITVWSQTLHFATCEKMYLRCWCSYWWFYSTWNSILTLFHDSSVIFILNIRRHSKEDYLLSAIRYIFHNAGKRWKVKIYNKNSLNSLRITWKCWITKNNFEYLHVMKEIARNDILITLATQLTITDMRRYILLKVGAWLLSVHISMYGRRWFSSHSVWLILASLLLARLDFWCAKRLKLGTYCQLWGLWFAIVVWWVSSWAFLLQVSRYPSVGDS